MRNRNGFRLLQRNRPVWAGMFASAQFSNNVAALAYVVDHLVPIKSNCSNFDEPALKEEKSTVFISNIVDYSIFRKGGRFPVWKQGVAEFASEDGG
jgi:hypothetical protein